jgi:hypothetical protein
MVISQTSLVRRFAGSHGFRSRFPPAGHSGPSERPEPEPGNLSLGSRLTGLPQDSVANVSQILTLDKELLTERKGKLPQAKFDLLLAGIDVVLGR